MYSTRFPCIDCARAIVFCGITRIVVGGGLEHRSSWIDSQRGALRLFRLAGVTIRYFTKRS